MCHYITAVMSADGDEQAICEVAQACHLAWKRLENQSIEQQLRDGERYFLTTRGSCNCGTQFGVLSSSSDGEAVDYAAKKIDDIRRKGRRKGWTPTKVDRVIGQERAAQQRRRAQTPDQSDLWQLQVFVTEVLGKRHASYLGLFLHYYDDTLESEEIALSNRRWIRQVEFDEAIMENTPEDAPLFVSNE